MGKRWREGETEQERAKFSFWKSIFFGTELKTQLLPDMSWWTQVEGAVNKLVPRPQAEPQGS